ncbi:ATP-binding protein [Candidatus Methanocrinis natronophilus]|uniref:ATP-binding protein n=1 Tax=Candidatus Methanocrinis natronophilus TaxID=3033396 RepID=A0ABT5XAY4_9EURY|nr:ATP-binding protein [Candidatus Methanocrinis natronophilus]MDF0591879.1 ATP-binding protein [Candidatus Methanocrinis natronophilus]
MLSVASGKGGTGKTLVATNLAASLPERRVILADCDVEEPNAHLFFPDRETIEEAEISVPIPVVDEDRCSRCGECSQFCAFHALAVFPSEVLIFPELCHGCGGCVIACPERAISEGSRNVGRIYHARAGPADLVWGELRIGEARTTPLIRAVKEMAGGGRVIIDSPPGTSCPMVEAVRGSDFCLLVTEPTPFGLYDLKIAVKVLEDMEIPHGVLINKSGIGDRAVYRYLQERNIPLLMEIPMSRRIAEIYSRGGIFIREMPEWAGRLSHLWTEMEEMIS